VCGKRIPASSAKCPECGFNIQSYLKGNNDHNLKESVLSHFTVRRRILAAVVLVGIIVCMIPILYISGKSSADTIDNENTTDSGISGVSEDRNLTTNTDLTPVGVYSGDDNEILVINSDGLAYYYCADQTYTELLCPWSFMNGTLTISLSKLHCDISADFSGDDTSQLVFKSDSINWNTEVFEKIDVDPDNYIKRSVTTYDTSASVQGDGTLLYTIDNIDFVIPRQYIDTEDEFDSDDSHSVFLDIDTQKDYIATLIFAAEDVLPGQDSKTEDFLSGFLDDVSISDTSGRIIAGMNANVVELSGKMNGVFGKYAGYNMSGTLAEITDVDNNKTVYCLFVQTDDRGIDTSDVFTTMIDTAQ
jgi:hypothetical protein